MTNKEKFYQDCENLKNWIDEIIKQTKEKGFVDPITKSKQQKAYLCLCMIDDCSARLWDLFFDVVYEEQKKK